MILSVYQIVTYNKAELYRRQNAYYIEFIELQDNYTKHIIKSEHTIRKFRHDMHSHLTVIREYNKEGKKEQIEEYLESIGYSSGLYDRQKFVGNTAVDAIVSDLYRRAKEVKVVLNVHGLIPQNCMIRPYDLCIVISNLLRNAIEASTKLIRLEKVIEFEVNSYENHLYLMVSNHVENGEQLTKGTFTTTKENQALHGFGMLNVREGVSKYSGSIDFAFENDQFEVHILL